MSNSSTLARIIIRSLYLVAETYESQGILPNMIRTNDTMTISITYGRVALNFTLVLTVVEQENEGYYFDVTAYFGQEDYIYPEGASHENAEFIIRAAPYHKVFSESYTATGDSLEEAMADAFYVLMGEIEEIVKTLSVDDSE